MPRCGARARGTHPRPPPRPGGRHGRGGVARRPTRGGHARGGGRRVVGGSPPRRRVPRTVGGGGGAPGSGPRRGRAPRAAGQCLSGANAAAWQQGPRPRLPFWSVRFLAGRHPNELVGLTQIHLVAFQHVNCPKLNPCTHCTVLKSPPDRMSIQSFSNAVHPLFRSYDQNVAHILRAEDDDRQPRSPLIVP